MDALGLPGRHNRRNALIARACLRALGVPGADDDEAMRAAAEGYVGLPSRLTTIGVVDGVSFMDDSLSTNVLPDAGRPGRVPRPAGRPHRRRPGPWHRLRPAGSRRARPAGADVRSDHCLTAGRGSAAFKAAGQAAGRAARARGCARLPRPGRRRGAGFDWARPDGIVLLSPAAPSFGRFRDYSDRAEAFARAMHALTP